MGFDAVSFIMGRKSAKGGGGSDNPPYVLEFDNSQWTSTPAGETITVSPATHKKGRTPRTDLYTLNGSAYEKAYGYPSTGKTVSVSSDGTVTITVQDEAFIFAGRLLIW